MSVARQQQQQSSSFILMTINLYSIAKTRHAPNLQAEFVYCGTCTAANRKVHFYEVINYVPNMTSVVIMAQQRVIGVTRYRQFLFYCVLSLAVL